MLEGWITRKEEEEIPAFSSRKEAIAYFRAKYGNDFIVQNIEEINGQDCYFCVLIVNRAAYEAGQQQLLRGQSVTGNEYLFSHQPIQIMEDGGIHIVH